MDTKTTGQRELPSWAQWPPHPAEVMPAASAVPAPQSQPGEDYVTFETRIGVESEQVFVLASRDADGDIGTVTVSPLVEGRPQMDISGYLEQPTVLRLNTEARRAFRAQDEQRRADAEIDRFETEQTYREAA